MFKQRSTKCKCCGQRIPVSDETIKIYFVVQGTTVQDKFGVSCPNGCYGYAPVSSRRISKVTKERLREETKSRKQLIYRWM